MAEEKTVQLRFRVSPEKARMLEALSVSNDRPQSWLLEQALDNYLETQAWQIPHVEQGLTDAAAGRTIPHERVRKWLQTWGSENESEPPD